MGNGLCVNQQVLDFYKEFVTYKDNKIYLGGELVFLSQPLKLKDIEGKLKELEE